MAEYTVTYNIKTNTFNTIQQLTELARVAGKMHGAAEQIKKVTTAINNLNRACGGSGGKGIAIKIDISQAQKQIAALEAQVQKLRNSLAAGGKAGPVAGGRGGRGGSGGRTGSTTGTQPVATYGGGRTSYMRQPQRPASNRIIPRNIAYRNLGPAFIDSGSGALDMVKGMGIMYGLSGMGAMFGQAVSDYVDYNNIITTTKSILGTHDKRPNFSGRFAGMEKQIRQIGMRTKYTAPEVADASRYLAMAGLDIEAINKAMNSITNIALISDSDLAETADVVTNIMTSYKMKPEQLNEIADHLTMGFTMSNTTLMEMAEAYKYFGSIASNVGVDFKETVAMLGILGDAGLKGSHAGTTMRQIMNNMMKPTKKQMELWSELGIERKDSEGNLKSMIQLFSELAEKGAVKRAFELFRVTAAQGAVSLMSDQMGPHKLQRMMEALNQDTGISDTLAEAKINNLEGLWKQIQSSFTEAAMQALADFEPQATNIMKQLINWLQSNEGRSFVRELTGSIFELMKSVGELTAAFVDMCRKFAPIINFWLKMQIILQAIIIPMRIIKGLWNFMLGGAAIAQKMGTWTRSFADFRLAFKDTGSLRAGASAFMNTMRGVAYTAQQTAGIVTSSGMAIMGANGKVMGSLGIQGTPLSGKNGEAWVTRRNFFESQFFNGNGSMARLTRLRTEMARNSDIMYNLANTPNSKLPESERQRLLAFYSNRNQAIWSQIEKMYQDVDPTKNKKLTSNRNLKRLQTRVNQFRGIYESNVRRFGENSRGAKTWYGKWKDAERRLQSATMGARNSLGIAQANYAAMQEANQMAGGGYVYNPQERRIGGFWSRQWGRVKTAGSAIRNSWNNPNHRAAWTGGLGMLGGAVGGIAGSVLGNSDYSGMIWGTLGSLLPLFLSTGPVGWAVGAIAGVAALANELVNASEKADAAREAMKHLGDSLRIENGFLAGDAVSNMSKYYQLMYDSNLSINDQLRIRVSLLREAQGLETPNEEERHESIKTAFEKAYDLIDDASGIWGNSKAATNLTVKEEAQNFLNQFLPHVQFVRDVENGGWSLPDRNGNMEHIRGTHSNVYNMIASARYAGFTDESSVQEINNTLDAFVQAMQSGDETRIMELYQKMSARYENAQTKNVEEKAMMRSWDFYNVGSLKSYGIEKTEPYLQGQMDLFAPAVSEMKNRLAAYGRWKHANETGEFTKNSLLDYLLIQSDSRLVDLARWNTSLPANQSLDTWFMYDEANKSFGQKTLTDRYGNVIDTLTPTENAQRLIDTFNIFNEKWTEFNPKQQQQWQELYDYLQTHSQIAAEFVKKNTDDMLQNMAAKTPVTMGFENIGGQMYLTAKAAAATTYVNMGKAPYLSGWSFGNSYGQKSYNPTDMFDILKPVNQIPYKPKETPSSPDGRTAYQPNNMQIHTNGPLVNIDASAVAQLGDITNVEKFGTMLAEYLQSAYG